MRRIGRPPRRDIRYRPRPGAYAVLHRGRDILLTRQAEPVPEFQLPGGGIEPGEHAIPALARECLEETGWTISRPRRVGAFRRFAYMPEFDLWAEKLCLIYEARAITRLGPAIEAGHSAHLFPRKDALAMLPDSILPEHLREKLSWT
ncbi:MAG: NUDIX hydrolase [Pseudomonadota bacterium]